MKRRQAVRIRAAAAGQSETRPASIPCADWAALVGGPVQIRHRGESVQSGIVDAAMEDSSALWLEATATSARRCFAKSEGYEAWISPRQLQPSPRPQEPAAT